MATTQQVTATPRNASGVAITGKTATWSSTNTAVATVSGTGLVTSVAPGTTGIRAIVDGITGESTATVVAASSQSFTLTASTLNNTAPRTTYTQFLCTITRLSGYTGTVTLTPTSVITGVTVTAGLTESTATSSTLTLSAGQTQFYVRVAANGSATLGAFSFNLAAVGTGGTSANVYTQFNVTSAPTGSITATASPADVEATAGMVSQAFITLTRVGSFTGVVTPYVVSFTGANGPTVSFSPTTLGVGVTACTVNMSFPGNFNSAGSNSIELGIQGVGVASYSLASIPIIDTT